MKRFLAILLMAISSAAYADVVSINQFGGLNTDDSPLTLQNGQTPDSRNLVTDDGPGVKGRLGYIRYSTEPSSGNIWEFPLSNGTRYLITRSGGNLKATTDGTFSITIGTVPTDRNIAATTLGDKFFFSDTQNGLKYWDGTTLTTSSRTMTFSMLTTYKGRLAGAGKSGSERVIFLSKYLDGTNWTLVTNPNEDDPAQITVSGSIDENIQALFSSFQDKLMWFKKNSFGAISGSRRSNFVNRTYSDAIGVASVETIRDCDGELRWMGNNKKIYQFDGASFQIISEDIDELTDTIIQGDSNSSFWTQTSEADWNSGSFDSTIYVDTYTASGTLSTLYPDNFSTYRNGNSGTKNVWYDNIACANCSHSVSSVGGQLEVRGTQNGIENPVLSLFAVSSTSIVGTGTTYYMKISSLTMSTSDVNPTRTLFFTLTNSTRVISGNSLNAITATNNYFYVQFISTPQATHSIRLRTGEFNGTTLGAAGFSGSFSLPITFSFFITPSTYQFTINGSSIVRTGSHTFPTTGPIYPSLSYITNNGSVGIEQGFTVDDFSIVPQTFTFTSALKSVPNLTSWGTFQATDANSGGSQTYSMRASSASMIGTSTFTFTVSTSGSTPAISTGAYFQIRDFFQVTSTVGATPLSLFQFTQNWNEGASISASSGYIGQRYWLGVAISSTSSNRVLVYDKADEWQIYDGYVPETMGIYNSRLYVGNTNGVFLSESSNADNGTAITAYYTAKTLAPSNLDYYAKFNEVRFTSDESDNSLNPTFQINTGGTNYSLGSTTMDQNTGINNLKFPFSASQVQQGKFIDLKFTVAGSSFWRILNANLYYDKDVVPD